MAETKALPAEAVGLRLARITSKGELVLCEAIRFGSGHAGVDTTLRRAAISGRVEIGGGEADWFADVLDDNGDIIETVSLDAKSYGALKNRWMRCRVEPAQSVAREGLL